MTNNSSFTFIDLFAGIGGMRRAFEIQGGQCVFGSEWDRFSRQTYMANFDCSEDELAGDITEIDESAIPEHDVLLAGFPCQPFSLAGVSKKNSLNRPHGFECDTQGTLFFDVARIIAAKKPKAFLLENVRNLVSHDQGKTFKVILRVLTEELDYQVSWKILDARHWVPQHRERIFIVGVRDGKSFDFNKVQVPASEKTPILQDILHPENGSEIPEGHYTVGKKAKVSDKYVLSDPLWTYLQNYAEKHRRKGNGFGFGLVGHKDRARTLSARYHKDGSEILIRRPRGNPRRLTPRECARLMGFDSPGTKTPFLIPVSDTQAYRQFGNSVAVPVITAIADALTLQTGLR